MRAALRAERPTAAGICLRKDEQAASTCKVNISRGRRRRRQKRRRRPRKRRRKKRKGGELSCRRR